MSEKSPEMRHFQVLRTWRSQGWPLPGRLESLGRQGNEKNSSADTVGRIITTDLEAKKEILDYMDDRSTELEKRVMLVAISAFLVLSEIF